MATFVGSPFVGGPAATVVGGPAATYLGLPAPVATYAAPVPAVPVLPSQNLTELDFIDPNANAYFASQKTRGVRARAPVVQYTHQQYSRDAAAQGVFVHPDPTVHQAMTLRQQKNDLLMQYQHRDQITNDLIQHQFVAQRERPLTVGQVTYLDKVAADNWDERNRLVAGDPTLIPGTDPRTQIALTQVQTAVAAVEGVEASRALVPYSGSPLPAVPSPYSINNYGPFGVPTAPVYQSSYAGVPTTYNQYGRNGLSLPQHNPFATFYGQPAIAGGAYNGAYGGAYGGAYNGAFPGSQTYQGYIPNSIAGGAYSNYSSYVPTYYGNFAPLAGLNSGTLVRGFNN